MYSRFQLAAKYLRYYLTASNGKGHGIHSPFVFDFVTHVLNDKRNFYAYDSVEQLRQELLLQAQLLEIEDLGAGTAGGREKQRSIAGIARRAAKPKKYGQLLFRIAHHYQYRHMLELGTSLGLTTSYLALANPGAKVLTIEGAGSIADRAAVHFELLDIKNITLYNDAFDDCLPGIVQQHDAFDLVFIDGNHRLEPTIRYFNMLLPCMHSQSVMIFDDIHWSAEMEEAWRQVKNHPAVMLTIDLFFIGLVFFSPSFKVKQDFIIRF